MGKLQGVLEHVIPLEKRFIKPVIFVFLEHFIAFPPSSITYFARLWTSTYINDFTRDTFDHKKMWQNVCV
jgi:hypothetical protein